ncbi:MAG TPA: DNA-3-methyladenine glycosylase 2 family protein [Actinomycetota bacterium]|nr:DNA-3-methyladenine glycosylase 2 family protein [Actinomycetota bacterium]
MPSRSIQTARPIDLAKTFGPLRRGTGDPTMRIASGEVVRASRTPDGPASVRFVKAPGGIEVEAWGHGAAWILEHAPAWLGVLDDDSGFEPPPGLVRDLWRRHRGLRIPRTGLVTERLIPVILGQKVTGQEARRTYRRLAAALAEPAPGPSGLSLPPDPSRVPELPYQDFHPFGIERRRAELLRAACARSGWFEAAAELPLEEARARLGAVGGIGPWTVAEVARTALGDTDAVSVGDFHVPNVVCWALAGEPRGSNERMLELLEPYRPHRGRVQRLLEVAGIRAPAFGPRMEARTIDRI